MEIILLIKENFHFLLFSFLYYINSVLPSGLEPSFETSILKYISKCSTFASCSVSGRGVFLDVSADLEACVKMRPRLLVWQTRPKNQPRWFCAKEELYSCSECQDSMSSCFPQDSHKYMNQLQCMIWPWYCNDGVFSVPLFSAFINIYDQIRLYTFSLSKELSFLHPSLSVWQYLDSGGVPEQSQPSSSSLITVRLTF